MTFRSWICTGSPSWSVAEFRTSAPSISLFLPSPEKLLSLVLWPSWAPGLHALTLLSDYRDLEMSELMYEIETVSEGN